MKLLVLAGGFGTRLQSVLPTVPKALAPVGTLPFLYLQIEHWKSQGIYDFVFLLHHESGMIISFLEGQQSGLLHDCEVRWLVEPTPLGTGGAVAYATEQLNLVDNFLLTNADTWLGTGMAALRHANVPAIAVVELRDATRYGCVQFDKKHSVTAFTEKNNREGSGWINAGLCRLNAETFKDWDHMPFSLERLTFPAMVTRGDLKAVTLQTDFIDIGIPDDYYRFCRWIAANREGAL